MVVTRAYVFQTRGGGLLAEFEPADLGWSAATNEPEQVSVTVDLNRRVEFERAWRNLGAEWAHSIALDVGGRLLGGPIVKQDFDGNKGELHLEARGIRQLFSHRFVLPVAALSTPMVLDDGTPNPALNTSLSGLELGTIMKRLVQQAAAWPGWTDIPFVFEADRVGSHERVYEAADRKNLDDAISDLSGVENGPDFRAQLRWASESSFEWFIETGTETQPRLQSESVFAWEVSQASGLHVSTDPSRMASVSWSEGGKSDDTTLIESLYDSHLVDLGFPLLEVESDASSNTKRTGTLHAWNVETLRTARKPWEFWSFDVPANRSPFPYEYREGDLVQVDVVESAPVAGGYVPKGSYRRRIVKVSGGVDDLVSITCGEHYDNG